ncbi:MAG TPA: efflux RND transporter permease subunit [Candidatus Saccharibacteria bacterium]|nr:efflux RND transporter permease subunit [Candidatus Saccharibacteria bacterium]
MRRNLKDNLNIWQRIGLFFFDRPIVTVGIWLVIVGFGILSYTSFMRREGFPSVDVPLGVINVISFNESAEQTDQNYTIPLLEAIGNNPFVKSVRAQSTDQGASIQITFTEGTDVQSALNELEEKNKGTLSDKAKISYIKVSASKLTVKGDDLLISVHKEGKTAEALDMAAAALGKVIQEEVPLVKSVNLIPNIEQLNDPTTGQNTSQQVRFDRYYDKATRKVVSSSALGVTGVENVDQLELYDQVKKVLGGERVASIDVEASVAADFAEGIRTQVSSLQQNLFEGLLVVLVVSFILISLRASLVTALSMTTTIAATIGVLHLIGYSLNTITLFSLVLCLALIVDDTTIVVEAIDAGLKKQKIFRSVVSESLGKVVRASATGTFTTILAFAPMLFISGILGEFIRAIPVTIIISLLSSLAVSFIFIPLFMKFTYARSERKRLKESFVGRLEKRLGSVLSGTLLWSTTTKFKSLSFKLHALLLAAIFVLAGALVMRTVEFNIFPNPKDGDEIRISIAQRERGVTKIAETEILADQVMNDVQKELGDNLERMTLLSQNGASRDSFTITARLNPIDERSSTSVDLAQHVQNVLNQRYQLLNVTAEASGVGPPPGKFTVQVVVADNPEASYLLARDIQAFLIGASLTRVDGSSASLKDTSLTPKTIVIRDGERRVIEVSAGFEDKDVSTLVSLAEDAVRNSFNTQRIESYGLTKDSLKFDFGQEDENQKSFESMGKAAGPLFIGMILLMAVLFRSVLQSFLILNALPFALFGIATGLAFTQNALSFFTMLGVFALIGISVNNAILLIDYANQERAKLNVSAAEAMAHALKARLRPLLTTSSTSILALLPLALNDPFWEGIAYTLIFGLLSSTILVILVFPYFYLIEEGVRYRIRRILKRSI